MYSGQAGYSSLVVLASERMSVREEAEEEGGVSSGPPPRSSLSSWRVEVGVSFQLGHSIHGVEGGGYDMAFARRTVTIQEK